MFTKVFIYVEIVEILFQWKWDLQDEQFEFRIGILTTHAMWSDAVVDVIHYYAGENPKLD